MVVTKLDRIVRSATQRIGLVQNLLDNGISVHVLNMERLDNISMRKFILTFAEFEGMWEAGCRYWDEIFIKQRSSYRIDDREKMKVLLKWLLSGHNL